MNIVFILLFIIPLFSGYTPDEYYLDRSINIVYVEPLGETFTDTEKDITRQSITNSFSFWNGYIDMPLLNTEKELSVQNNVYTSVITEWCDCTLTKEITNTLTIFVIDNSNSKASLGMYEAGYASEYFSFMVVLLDSSPVSLSAVIAHELGHIYFWLPDWYKDMKKCQGIDVMCYPQKAYEQKFLGCYTKEFLADRGFGRPCYTHYLPQIIR